MLKNLKGLPFTVFGIVRFFKTNNFCLKIKKFLRPSTLYPIFVFFQDRCFLCDIFRICFHRSPSLILQETKRFASVKDSSRFSALCDLLETFISKIFKNPPPFSVFFLSFPLKKMGFLVFPVGEEWFLRLVHIPSGIFWRCTIDEVLTMSFYPWFYPGLIFVSPYDIAYLVFFKSSQVFAKHGFASVFIHDSFRFLYFVSLRRKRRFEIIALYPTF